MNKDKNIEEILNDYQNIIENQRNKLTEIFKNDEFNIFPYNKNNIKINNNKNISEISDSFNIIQNNKIENKIIKFDDDENKNSNLISNLNEEEKFNTINEEDKNKNNMDGLIISNNSKSRTNSKNKLNSKYEANYPLDSTNKDNIIIFNNSNIKKNENFTFSSNTKQLPIISKTQSKNNYIYNITKNYDNITKFKYNGKTDCVKLYFYYRHEWDKYNIIKEMEKKDLKNIKIINSNLKPEYQFI